MDYKEKIIQLMIKKQEIISNFDETLKELYFNNKDRLAIEKWGRKECGRIFNKIKLNILFKHNHGLYSFSCPFCIKCQCSCMECEYRDNHGDFLCNDYDSDWNKITKNEDIHKAFTNELYRKILKETEYSISKLKYL